MKARRQMRILELVRGRVIETQEQLAELLGQEGIEVTQATVSRDIKELNLVKIPAGDGRYRYMPSDDSQPAGTAEKMKRLLADCCVSIDNSDNIVVVKTLSGTASAVGEAIDNLRWQEIVGCVAGDNTIIMVVKPREAAFSIVERLRSLTS
ncbi:MAG: arginine repressor [Firmicutes bacterium]|nr:arginine repressor [Bacillota bacterium]